MRPSGVQRAGRLGAALALVSLLLAPAAALPARAANPLVLRVGTTQDLDASNPYQTLLATGYEAFQLTYNLLVDFGPNLEPVPGFADSWTRAADGKSWTFHIRTGMKWSDGQPATSADACFSWGLAVAAIKDGANIGAGYLDPSLKDAGVTKVTCPDDQTMIAYTTDPSDRIFQIYLPILPQHIYGKETYKTIGDAKFDAPLVGTGPYVLAEWKTSQYARFVRNPNYWGTQGAADEVVIQFFKTPTRWSRPSRRGEIDYARDPNPDQTEGARGPAQHPDRRRQLERLDPARLQRVRRHEGADAVPGRRAVHPGALGSGLPRRPGLRDRQEPARPARPRAATASRARRSSRPCLAVARGARPPANLRHRDGAAEARRGRLHARRPRPPPRQAGQADQPPAGLPEHEATRTRRSAQFVVDWYGQLGIKVTATAVRLGDARQHRPAAGGRQGLTRPTTTSSCGAGRGTRTRTRCSRSSAATRSAPPPTASTATLPSTRCTTRRTRRRRPTRARRSWPRCRT